MLSFFYTFSHSYSKLLESLSNKPETHCTPTNTLTKEWNMVYEVLWQRTIAHCQWSVITPFSFCFTPMKLPLALRVMQNTDKCKKPYPVHPDRNNSPPRFPSFFLSTFACSDSNISFTMFRQFMPSSLTM